ncbi:hypothetical protein K439DRAFT_1616898 [Ramaria rubella]|nr:hypothetical protein K439DRAFT_1616898 [Ramaria rubella]
MTTLPFGYSARARDNQIAAELADAKQTGNLPNMQNAVFERERQSVQCRGWAHASMGAHSALINHFHTLEEERSAGAAKKKESLERQKDINTRLCELHSTHYQRRSDEDNQEIQDLEFQKHTVALENGIQNGLETDNGLPADIDTADNMVVNSSLQFHNCSNLPVQASILAPQIGLPPPVPSTSVTALDDLAAFEEANHDKLAVFFDDPSVQKLMDQSMSV